MIFVPIGVDCGIATELRDNKLRMAAYPFDWVVTYNGVSDIIKQKFSSYLPVDANFYDEYDFESRKMRCSRISHTLFMHNIFPDDIEKLNRRIQRFLWLLQNTTEEIIFIRKGHAVHHHTEAKLYNVTLKCDIADAEQLYVYLSQKYPMLKFKILVFLFCDTCFEHDKTYLSKYQNMYIFRKKSSVLLPEIFNFFQSLYVPEITYDTYFVLMCVFLFVLFVICIYKICSY